MNPVFNADYQTQAAGTAIKEVIPPVSGKIARITDLVYEAGGTQHTLTVLRPLGKTVSTADADSGQADVNLADVSPAKNSSGVAEQLAANDWLIWKDVNGQYQAEQVSAVSGDVVTMSSNFSAKVDNGTTFWALYEIARAAHQVLKSKTSTRNAYAGLKIQGGVAGQVDQYNARSGDGDPLLFYSDNVTAAGFLEQLSGEYVDAADVGML